MLLTPQIATEFAMETIAKHPIQGPFAAVLVHQITNAMVCSELSMLPFPSCKNSGLSVCSMLADLQMYINIRVTPQTQEFDWRSIPLISTHSNTIKF